MKNELRKIEIIATAYKGEIGLHHGFFNDADSNVISVVELESGELVSLYIEHVRFVKDSERITSSGIIN